LPDEAPADREHDPEGHRRERLPSHECYVINQSTCFACCRGRASLRIGDRIRSRPSERQFPLRLQHQPRLRTRRARGRGCAAAPLHPRTKSQAAAYACGRFGLKSRTQRADVDGEKSARFSPTSVADARGYLLGVARARLSTGWGWGGRRSSR
jgi:hypothetical protein